MYKTPRHSGGGSVKVITDEYRQKNPDCDRLEKTRQSKLKKHNRRTLKCLRKKSILTPQRVQHIQNGSGDNRRRGVYRPYTSVGKYTAENERIKFQGILERKKQLDDISKVRQYATKKGSRE